MKNRILLLSIIGFLFSVAALNAKIQYVFPKPGSERHPKETVLIIRFEDTKSEEISNFSNFITVSGELSGLVSGKTIKCADGKTINFKPYQPYISGEKITVHLTPQIAGFSTTSLDTVFHFKISEQVSPPGPINSLDQINLKKALDPDKLLKKRDVVDPIVRNGISIPSDFPWVNITIKDNPDSGYIFLNNWGGPPYNMILDNDGNPVWYWKTDARQRDFKVQVDGRLTMRVMNGYNGGGHIALDSTYSVVDTFYAPPGYVVDEHELQVLPNGNYFLIALEWQVWDISDIVPGGDTAAVIVGNHIAEMDADDNPVFIWRCWDNYDIRDAIHENLTAGHIDYIHMNAIEIDLDGHILVSCRHMSEVTKVHRQTGEILWRLGGLNDDFSWDDPDRISYQHDIRVLPNGNYTVFDNGNYHSPHFSRALEFQLDTLGWTATKVWEFRDSPDKYTWWMGNAQRLPSGNTLINWADGSLPKITEVRPDGLKVLELNFENGAHCYRVFKFPWQGKAKKPYLMAESYFDRITLLFNKFGDNDVAYFNIYGGLSPQPDQVIATSEEPFIHLFELNNLTDYFFRITAVNSKGQESEYSNEEMVYVRITPSGENMIINGDFSDGFNYWDYYEESSQASAEPVINGTGELELQISDPGSEYWHIQALYPNLTLVEDKDYLFEFDAYAAQNRLIEAEIRKDGDPWTNYSRIGLTWITQTKQHFSHQFTMTDPTEFQARVVLNVGGDDSDTYFDNVSLREIVTSIDIPDSDLPTKYQLEQNFPNPFNPTTTIIYHVPELSNVSITIYNILGESVKTLINLLHNPGIHKIAFDGTEFHSGVYFYQMTASSLRGPKSYNQVNKMMLIK